MEDALLPRRVVPKGLRNKSNREQASPLMREFSASWQFFKTNVI